jgi:hypothetical protein
MEQRELKFRIYAFIDKAFIYFDIYEGYPHGIYGSVSPPQQFTGLKDKNGKEIYEGDILLDTTENGGKYKEVYQSQAGEWQVSYHTKESLENGFKYCDVLYDRCEYSEVIGNTFKNKELLK